MMSKIFITMMSTVTNTVMTVGQICGTTMLKKIRFSLAPSIRPASIVSSGTPLTAADSSTMEKPTCAQIMMTMSNRLLTCAWLSCSQAHVNSLLLMVIMIWAQVGFSMVLLSAAVKGVPEDTIEAGRIDGASEKRIFFNIVVPQIWPTVITVFVTVLIMVMKIFDIIYVMTGGNFNTDVIGMRFWTELFTNGNNGYAAAIVVMLMIAIVPVMVYQVRNFRRQEAQR